jgi:transcriptional regulator with XRE-family HTH domain
MKEIKIMKTATTKKHLTEDQIKRNFGRFISTHRKLLDMTQRQLADRTGMDNTYISRLEKGLIAKPRPETLDKIANALNIDVKVLSDKVYPKKNKEGLFEDSTIVFDPDNKKLPSYFMELLYKESEEVIAANDINANRKVESFIATIMKNLFERELEEGDLIKECIELLENKLKREILAKTEEVVCDRATSQTAYQNHIYIECKEYEDSFC